MGKNRDFQRKKRHLTMGHERTAPFEALKKPPALRVEVTGLAHKASGLSPASFRSPVLPTVSRGNPDFRTDRGTGPIRLVLYWEFLPLQAPAKMGQERPEIGQGLFPYSGGESLTQARTSGTAGAYPALLPTGLRDFFFFCAHPQSFSLFMRHSFCTGRFSH